MTAKEYLAQVRLIDTRINNKLAQVSELRDLATKATSVLSDMPRGDSPNLQSMEGIIVKIVDMENEVNGDIDGLIDLKREILEVIQRVRTPAYQALLEMRYLGFMTWEDIAEASGCDIRSAYRTHRGALRAVDRILWEQRSDENAQRTKG
jgi:hypothetical protein